jgi:hypothetical protein
MKRLHIHPIKSSDNPIRHYHKEKREQWKAYQQRTKQ